MDKYIFEEERNHFFALLVKEAHLVDISVSIKECRDPKDNKFLEAAVCGEADCIISGDRDLLEMHPFQGIPILKPQEFLQVF